MKTTNTTTLGAFSVSLAVKDLAASRAFYQQLGFEAVAGDPARGMLILRNGAATIGLFQGMFERNTLTFNPVDFGDAGTYQVVITDQGNDAPITDSALLTVENGVPVGGVIALSIMSITTALAGAKALHRRRSAR